MVSVSEKNKISNAEILVGKKLFRKLSAFQKKIIIELSCEPLTLCELSERLGNGIFSTGKQLSLLQFRTKYNPLLKKGIIQPLVKKKKEAGEKTLYSIIPKNNKS